MSAARRIDAHELYCVLDRFQSGNANSPSIEHRWLAAYAGDLKTMAWNVKNNQRGTIKKQVNAFRLREIKAAKEKLQAQSILLETEEAKLLREIEQLPPEMIDP
jgi:hypothetical protein